MSTRPSDINTVRDESLSGAIRRGLLWTTILASLWIVPLIGVAVGALLEGRAPGLFLPGDGIRSLFRILGAALKPTGEPWWGRLPNPDHGPRSPVDLFAGLMVGVFVYAAAATAGWQTLMTRTGWREKDRAQRRQMDGAAWAEPHEISHLLVSEDELGDRVALGWPRTPRSSGRRIAAVEPGHSVLVVAPPGQGKSDSVLGPAIAGWDGYVVCVSIKRDVFDLTAGSRAKKGEVRVLDPAGLTNPLEVRNATWTPIAEARSWQAARTLADQMCGVGLKGAQASQSEAYFANAAGELLAGLLFAASHSTVPTMDTVQRWLTTPGDSMPEIEGILNGVTRGIGGMLREDGTHEPIPDEVRWNAPHALSSIKLRMLGEDPRTIESIRTTVGNAIRAWNEWRFAHAAPEDPGVLSPDWLWAEPSKWEEKGDQRTLYVIGPDADQESYRGMFVGAISQIYNSYARAAQSDHPPKKRLLIVLDEVANMTPIANLDRWVTSARGLGMNIVMATQNLAQFDTVWGREKAETIASAPRVKMFGPAIADEQTLSYVERLGGDTAILSDTVSRRPYFFQVQTNRSTHTQWRPLVTKDYVRQIPAFTGVVFYGTAPPFTVDWRSAHNDKGLAERSNLDTVRPGEKERTHLTTPHERRILVVPPDPATQTVDETPADWQPDDDLPGPDDNPDAMPEEFVPDQWLLDAANEQAAHDETEHDMEDEDEGREAA